jgi:SPP1 family predicted phage head-tail adaptor
VGIVNGFVVRSGNLRRRLTFQTRQTTQDALGQQSTTWTDAFTVWGEIDALTGRELIAAQSVQSSVTHTITVRYRPELQIPKVVAAMRIVYGARIFDIHAAMNEDERNRVISILAEEGVSNG